MSLDTQIQYITWNSVALFLKQLEMLLVHQLSPSPQMTWSSNEPICKLK